jgi:hypothetical protein
VPDIPNKLIKLPVRKALTEQRKFWDIVLGELGSVNCIYTNKKLVIGDYAVEHFLPYAFVSHDLMWNLIPADRSFNGSKSDKLPALETYFDPYYQLQLSALEVIQYQSPKHKFLEDYLTIVPDIKLLTDSGYLNNCSRWRPLLGTMDLNGLILTKISHLQIKVCTNGLQVDVPLCLGNLPVHMLGK